MAFSLAFYLDAGLTALAGSLSVAQASDGSSAAVDRVVYLGSPVAGKKFELAANPGIDAISLSVADSASGSGVAASAVKLATTSGGLAGATPGAALSLGTQIMSGVGNARPIHLRVDTPALAAGVYTDISLSLPSLLESAA